MGSIHVVGRSKLFNISYAGPLHLEASPRCQWEAVLTKDTGNQRIAKSVRKGSTKIEYVTLLYLKRMAHKFSTSTGILVYSPLAVFTSLGEPIDKDSQIFF